MRLRPRDFWALSLPEWRALFDTPAAAPALARGEFESLMQAYPDAH